jgi:hypothetical protein
MVMIICKAGGGGGEWGVVKHLIGSKKGAGGGWGGYTSLALQRADKSRLAVTIIRLSLLNDVFSNTVVIYFVSSSIVTHLVGYVAKTENIWNTIFVLVEEKI